MYPYMYSCWKRRHAKHARYFAELTSRNIGLRILDEPVDRTWILFHQKSGLQPGAAAFTSGEADCGFTSGLLGAPWGSENPCAWVGSLPRLPRPLQDISMALAAERSFVMAVKEAKDIMAGRGKSRAERGRGGRVWRSPGVLSWVEGWALRRLMLRTAPPRRKAKCIEDSEQASAL